MKVLLVPSADPQTVEAARLLAARLTVAGIDTEVQPSQDKTAPVVPLAELALVVPMGGDGTFLAAARLIGFAEVPLLGLNYGRLGFLSGSPERDEIELVADALAGELPFERRTTVDVVLEDMDGARYEHTALNELAYTRGIKGHMIEYSYSVNGIPIASLRADGLIISTATGSTAYALSAGGPIMSPGYRGLLAVPIAPYTLNSRAMVLAPSDILEVELQGRDRADASVFVDGYNLDVHEYVRITAKRGAREVVFARGGGDFFTKVSEVFFR